MYTTERNMKSPDFHCFRVSARNIDIHIAANASMPAIYMLQRQIQKSADFMYHDTDKRHENP